MKRKKQRNKKQQDKKQQQLILSAENKENTEKNLQSTQKTMHNKQVSYSEYDNPNFVVERDFPTMMNPSLELFHKHAPEVPVDKIDDMTEQQIESLSPQAKKSYGLHLYLQNLKKHWQSLENQEDDYVDYSDDAVNMQKLKDMQQNPDVSAECKGYIQQYFDIKEKTKNEPIITAEQLSTLDSKQAQYVKMLAEKARNGSQEEKKIIMIDLWRKLNLPLEINIAFFTKFLYDSDEEIRCMAVGIVDHCSHLYSDAICMGLLRNVESWDSDEYDRNTPLAIIEQKGGLPENAYYALIEYIYRGKSYHVNDAIALVKKNKNLSGENVGMLIDILSDAAGYLDRHSVAEILVIQTSIDNKHLEQLQRWKSNLDEYYIEEYEDILEILDPILESPVNNKAQLKLYDNLSSEYKLNVELHENNIKSLIEITPKKQLTSYFKSLVTADKLQYVKKITSCTENMIDQDTKFTLAFNLQNKNNNQTYTWLTNDIKNIAEKNELCNALIGVIKNNTVVALKFMLVEVKKHPCVIGVVLSATKNISNSTRKQFLDYSNSIVNLTEACNGNQK